jgi:hypothetical protein
VIQPQDSTPNLTKKAAKPKPNWAEIEALYIAKVGVQEISRLHPGVTPKAITQHCSSKKLGVARNALQGTVRREVEKSVISVATEAGKHISTAFKLLSKEASRRAKRVKTMDDDGFRSLVETLKSLTMIRSDANPGDPSQDRSQSNQPIQINIGSMPIRRSEPRKIASSSCQVIETEPVE